MKLSLGHLEDVLTDFLEELLYVGPRWTGAILLSFLVLASGFNWFSQVSIEFLIRADQELRLALPYLGG